MRTKDNTISNLKKKKIKNIKNKQNIDNRNTLSENTFQKQKFKIAELLAQKNEFRLNNEKNQNQNQSDNNNFSTGDKFINFNDSNSNNNFDNWQFSTFEAENKNGEIFPRYSNKFSDSNIKPNAKGIEMRGAIFRSKEFINYQK